MPMDNDNGDKTNHNKWVEKNFSQSLRTCPWQRRQDYSRVGNKILQSECVFGQKLFKFSRLAQVSGNTHRQRKQLQVQI